MTKEWDCDGESCHCHEPSICPDCGCLHNEGDDVHAEANATPEGEAAR